MTKHTISTTTRIALALGASLIAGACASETASTGATVPPAESAAPAATTAPETTAPPSTAPPATAPPTTAPETATETTTPEPPPATTTPDPEPAPCGEFGEIPPVPDSMPTLVFDTDGDGTADDEVTAYGASDGWRVRIVENGVTSEALVDSIAGWAFLSTPIPTEGGDEVVLADNDTTATWTFATNNQGCIELVGQYVPAEDEDAMICGPLPAIPDDALVGEPFFFDFGDGPASNFLVAYQHDGVWKLRAEVETWEGGPMAQSEVEIPGAGVHGVRVIGMADVDLTYGGDEFVVQVGGGASAVELGLFTFLEGGCLTRYTAQGGGSYSQFVGGTVGSGSGLICVDGWLGHYGYELAGDDTYTAFSTPHIVTGFLEIGPEPIDGYYEEGLTFEEASADLFDCHGLSL